MMAEAEVKWGVPGTQKRIAGSQEQLGLRVGEQTEPYPAVPGPYAGIAHQGSRQWED